MDATPIDAEHVAFLERENALLAQHAIAATTRADRATRDVAALELQLEANAAATRSALEQAQRQLDRGAENLRIAHRRYDEVEAERDRAIAQRDALAHEDLARRFFAERRRSR